MKIQISEIKVNRERRQRRELTEIDELAASIRDHGLITPIALSRNYVLLAGERRLIAMKKLGWEELIHGRHFIFFEEMPEHAAQAIELLENIKRADLPWQDQCAAVMRYHQMRCDERHGWTQTDTAQALGLSQQHVSRLLDVANAVKSNPNLAETPQLSTAVNKVRRERERKFSAVLAELGVPEAPAAPEHPFLNADFREWARSYNGPPFNFLHCDLPYGIDMHKHKFTAKAIDERYEDTFETYSELISALPLLPIASDAVIFFWFSPKHYQFTLDTLRAQGWWIDPHPVIWGRSDNKGVIPDSHGRRLRYNYECAFWGNRGNYPILKSVSNVYWGPSASSIKFISPKPEGALTHFLSAFIDGTSSVLDPTCGSGSALYVAKRLGARRILGIERDPQIYADAVANWTELEIDL